MDYYSGYSEDVTGFGAGASAHMGATHNPYAPPPPFYHTVSVPDHNSFRSPSPKSCVHVDVLEEMLWVGSEKV